MRWGRAIASTSAKATTAIKSAVERVLEESDLSGTRIIAGLSGGVDSVVLLHTLVKLAPRLRLSLAAVHVHHGLSAHADRWTAFCVELCRDLGVPLIEARVKVDRRSGLGTEGAAREARYSVFRRQTADAIALAHHLDDQAETLLLQLLRGAGVRGLSAMPAARVLDRVTGLRLVRPLLAVTRAQILAYAAQARLSWVEDDSNSNPAYDRNFLRTQILPLLLARFPGAAATLARTARNLSDTAQLVDDLARSDGEGAVLANGLAVSALQALSTARALNLLRWFLDQQGLSPPSRDHAAEALRQVLAARRDAKLQVKLGAAILRRYRGRLYVEPTEVAPPRGWIVRWTGERELVLPGSLGAIHFEAVWGGGLSVARLREAEVAVRSRRGGERMRPAAGRPSRTLKNLLQEAQVPEWQRDRLPLVFAGDALVWVPGIGHDCRFAATPNEPGILLFWERAPAA